MNPIKASDIYQDDGAISKGIEQLGLLGKEIKKIHGVLSDLEKVVSKSNVAQESGRDEVMKAAKEVDRLAKEEEKLRKAYSDQEKEIAKLREERKKINRQTRNEIKLANSAKGSYDELSAQYSLNKQRLNAMSREQRKAAEASEGLVTQTRKIYEEMKELQKETGKTALNVGNYKDAVKEGISETFGLGNAMELISKTPLLAVLGLLFVGLRTLYDAFRQSEEGAILLERAGSVLNGIFGILVKSMNTLAGGLNDLFTDPKQALSDFGDSFKEFIIDRFNVAVGIFKGFGTLVRGVFTRDLELINKGAREAGDGILEMYTGLDSGERKEFDENLRRTREEFDALALSIRANRQENRELTKALQSVITEEERLRFIVEDSTLSFKERREASEAAFEATEQRAGLEVQIAQNNLDVINQEIQLKKAQGREIEDLKDRQVEAFVALAEANREYTMTVQENSRSRRMLIQDEREINLDILIDLFDNQKTINERLIADETKTAEERRALLDETRRLSDLSFREQVENLQAQAKEYIDINALINESDATRLVQEIAALDLSEINKTRLIEIIKERRLAVLDLNEAERDLKKTIEESRGTVSQSLDPLLLPIEQAKDSMKDISDVVGEMSSGEGIRQGEGGLLSQLGLEFGDKEKEALGSAVDFAKQKISELAAARVQASEEAVRASEREVTSAERALQAEIAKSEQGLAANIEARQEDLKDAESNQKEALKNRQRAQRAQLAIDSVTQASSLITAAAKIFKDVKFPFNLAAIGLMFGSFAAAKVRAFQATKLFSKGGLEFLDYGGSHASGNDIYVGHDGRGSELRAEKNEALAVFNPGATRKYRSILPEIVDSLNKGVFENNFGNMSEMAMHWGVGSGVSVDTSRMESHLYHIRKNGGQKMGVDGKGRSFEIRGNKKRIYV
jgi:hypothetical protein